MNFSTLRVDPVRGDFGKIQPGSEKPPQRGVDKAARPVQLRGEGMTPGTRSVAQTVTMGTPPESAAVGDSVNLAIADSGTGSRA